jgi:exodeoxyribonuclease V alpha subunit
LGSRPDTSSRFRHHRGNRLPHDVIVVDETSMVSLTMMARLLEAVRPQTRLLLVGDADQLASVEAGAVLADLVEGLNGRDDTRVAALTTSHRFGASIGQLASGIRVGDADRVIDVLLCAHRRGPFGVAHWNRQVERWLTEATGEPIWSAWYAGRPVLIAANDYGLGLYNGDTGVTVLGGAAQQGALRAVIAGAAGPLDFATSRLGDVETMHAMTIHKSQGSQADEVTVLMPPEDSRLLTRELFYTAVTRAKAKVRVVGSEAEVRAALDRRAIRATGLALRLQD